VDDHTTLAHTLFSPTQALAWLMCKVQQARQALSYQLSSMEEHAQVAYATNFLAEYLPERW
jgi:hypothetical protein